ncbi:tetratricopeptide repeat protein [bacterium]|nr:tetratricopeptide repeat protein [bacterium]
MNKRQNVMNWLKEFSKNFSLALILTLFLSGIAYAEVLSGGIRKEYNQPEKKTVELKDVEPTYSNGAILAYNRGIIEYKLSNYDEAIKYFKQAVKQEPRFADAYFNLGILYDYFENPKAAIITFNRAYVINKKDYEALYYMVKCYMSLGDNVAAWYYSTKIDKKSEFYTKAKQLLN